MWVKDSRFRALWHLVVFQVGGRGGGGGRWMGYYRRLVSLGFKRNVLYSESRTIILTVVEAVLPIV